MPRQRMSAFLRSNGVHLNEEDTQSNISEENQQTNDTVSPPVSPSKSSESKTGFQIRKSISCDFLSHIEVKSDETSEASQSEISAEHPEPKSGSGSSFEVSPGDPCENAFSNLLPKGQTKATVENSKDSSSNYITVVDKANPIRRNEIPTSTPVSLASPTLLLRASTTRNLNLNSPHNLKNNNNLTNNNNEPNTTSNMISSNEQKNEIPKDEDNIPVTPTRRRTRAGTKDKLLPPSFYFTATPSSPLLLNRRESKIRTNSKLHSQHNPVNHNNDNNQNAAVKKSNSDEEHSQNVPLKSHSNYGQSSVNKIIPLFPVKLSKGNSRIISAKKSVKAVRPLPPLPGTENKEPSSEKIPGNVEEEEEKKSPIDPTLKAWLSLRDLGDLADFLAKLGVTR
jgi:hypothetical protein